ncbi:MAG: AAA-like domain-containing protein [Cyanobacteria bacterium J06633_8]
MNPLELFPEAANWKIDELIHQLNFFREKFDHKVELSEIHKYYLCGKLAGYPNKEIAKRLNYSVNEGAIKTACSTEINPYIKGLLEYPDDLEKAMNWVRACVLLEKAGYKKSGLITDINGFSETQTHKEIEIIDVNNHLGNNNSHGDLNIDTNRYIERPPIEDKCLKAILQPGALIRIKAPHKMGKTLLLEKVLNYSREQGYKTAKLDLKLADKSILTDLRTFLQWLCSYVSGILDKEPNLDEYWQNASGFNISCTTYFQRHLLANTDNPLVLAIDNFERLFTYENIFSDFCLLLRSWYEIAKQTDRMGRIWKKLRLVVVNSTEVYPTLDINRSPFNVGLAIDLPELNQNQVEEIASKYQLDTELGEQDIIQIMTLIGGHPYLVQEVISHLKSQTMSLESILNLASTSQGIFSSHLGEILEILQADSQLEVAYKQVVTASEPVQLNPKITFKLHSLGLVKILGNDCLPSCDLYRQYFSVFLN